MAELPIDIEKVVREVLADMGLAPQAGDAGAVGQIANLPGRLATCPTTPAPLPQAGEGRSSVDGVLDVGSRVVTLAELGDRLSGVRRVVVTANAVVTPAVRDELARRNVSLVYGEPGAAERQERPGLTVVASGTKFDPAGLLKAMHDEGIPTEFERRDCLIATVDALVVALGRPDTLGVLLTRHTAAALCLANRVRGVRAVWALEAAAAARDAAAVGANLLVVDPLAAGPFQLKQMLVQFCRPGLRECPDVFRQRLG